MTWIIERLTVGIVNLIVVCILYLALAIFLPDWWQVVHSMEFPPPAVIEAIKAEAAAVDQFRWLSIGILAALWFGVANLHDRLLVGRFARQPLTFRPLASEVNKL